MPDIIADIAVNVPLKQLFTYRVPAALKDEVVVGCRVSVSFGRRSTIGVVVGVKKGQAEDLKDIKKVLDTQPLLTEGLLKLLRWAADYYCHPVGQVLRSALPADLGSEKSKTRIITEPCYCVTDANVVLRGTLQREIFSFLSQHEFAGLAVIREKFPSPYAILKRLVAMKAIAVEEREVIRDPFLNIKITDDKCLTLNDAQIKAVDSINTSITEKTFQGFLLHGVTGSGKTEVYLKTVQQCLEEGMQALILVP